ncbi:alpha/beta fold hydrolase [Solimonas sp. K1W22B-7]|uniref:alpha/beta fold hydrolase n=1 Tax=Solimonas sp. K1W22B-7 TaxID=2303331 RepID=UPI000E32F949|nr:alpha/beta fold hydrolase [Solimonas sp. K1W22B-7]AXQ28321.1 alpha/beta fold hydrolase [Solimonas sp. K1W22B-7]
MDLSKRLDEARAWGSGLERQRAALAASGVEIGFATVRGLRLRYGWRPGQGMPLLFCNGIGANIELALPLVRELKDVPVLLFDIPGTGGSPPAWLWPTLAQYARYAVGLLDVLGHRGPFTVAGVSWGGGLAQRIAYDYGERVRGLVLMSTSPGVTMVPGRLSALLRMTTPQRYLSRSYMARNAATIYGGEMRGRPDHAIAFAGMTRAPHRRTYLQQLAAMLTFSSLPWLHRVRCPALVMTGDDDPLVRPVNARILAALLPQGRLHVVRGGGHLFLALQPQVAGPVILDFLAGATAPA